MVMMEGMLRGWANSFDVQVRVRLDRLEATAGDAYRE